MNAEITEPAKPKILMVDDEPNVLSGYRRTIGRAYNLITANSGQEALDILDQQGPFSVVITDMRMPEMDGVNFLLNAREKHKNSVYVMLTGNADQQTAIDAINQGQIFRFLNKPCPPETLDHTIRACIDQYNLIHAEAQLLKNTLTGTVKLLVEAVMVSDHTIGVAVKSVRDRVQQLSKHLGVGSDWRLPLAGSLFLVGSIAVPRTKEMSLFSDKYLTMCAESGSNLLQHIPRLEEIGQIIARQRVHEEMPRTISMDNPESRIVIGAQLLRFAFDWYRETSLCEDDPIEGLRKLGAQVAVYDARLFDAAQEIVSDGEARPEIVGVASHPETISVFELVPGMFTKQEVKTSAGHVLITTDQQLTTMMIERLQGFAKAGLAEREILVLPLLNPGKPTIRKSA